MVYLVLFLRMNEMDIRLLNKVLVTFRDLTGVLLGHFSAFQYHTKPQTTLLDYE